MVPASPGALISANQFFHLAESDSESSTEEIHVPWRRPSRLVLVTQNVPVADAAMEPGGHVPDSHERRFMRRQAVRRERGVGQRQAPRGASPGPGGCTSGSCWTTVTLSSCLASVPPDIASALMSARLTALTKLDGEVRADVR